MEVWLLILLVVLCIVILMYFGRNSQLINNSIPAYTPLAKAKLRDLEYLGQVYGH